MRVELVLAIALVVALAGCGLPSIGESAGDDASAIDDPSDSDDADSSDDEGESTDGSDDDGADGEPDDGADGDPDDGSPDCDRVDDEPEASDGNATATFRADCGEITVSLEVADAPDERREGLMFRESLPENHGMVFVYEDAEPRSFWMKNTLIPLDIIFVSPDGTVLNVEHAEPQPDADDADLDRYESDGDAQYVIELEQGFANRTGVEAGTGVVFHDDLHDWPPDSDDETSEAIEIEPIGRESIGGE